MPLATICASHTPLMDQGVASDETRAAVGLAFADLAGFVRDFDPELVIQFSPDHFNGFFYDLMPPFCLGAAAESVGDYNTEAGPLPVPTDEARQLAEAVLADDLDLAVSLRMQVDHGFVQIWEKMMGSARRFPIIPIFINCAAPPLPSYRRARLLGEAVGRWAKATGKRVLLVASGGLSHDPPFPNVWTAPPEVRERLIAGRNPTEEARKQHVERVLAAGTAAARGEGPCQPLNPDWDRAIIQQLLTAPTKSFDDLTTDGVREVAGRGGNELLAWVATFAAQSVAGAPDAELKFYEPIAGWIAGMAMVAAREPPASA